MLNIEDLKFLEKIVGKENIKSDKAHLLAYCYDATRTRFEPDAVLFPKNENEISKILKYCNSKLIAIVPRGYGSGFTGGSLPTTAGIILSLDRHMDKLLEIDMENMLGIVQPGLVNLDFQKAVESVGLFYPPDPASEAFSTLGGNVAENAGGMRAAKYGITKDYVVALRAVLASGEIIVAGKKTIKDVAGFNIAGILTGSEGVLAVITEITLKLIPKPKYKKTYMGIFPNVDNAMNAVFKSLSQGANPVAMEFLDKLVIKAVRERFNIELPDDAGAILIGDVDGKTDDELISQLEILKKSFKDNGSIDFITAKNDEEAAKLWFARKNASPAVTIYGTKKLNEDISVPRSKLPEALSGIYEIGEKYGFNVPCFGHAGDGNIHVNVMIPDKENKIQMEDGHKAIADIFQYVVDLGGTLSGEHGIGISKAQFMGIAFTNAEMELFKSIKKAFDPNNILNPGKMGL